MSLDRPGRSIILQSRFSSSLIPPGAWSSGGSKACSLAIPCCSGLPSRDYPRGGFDRPCGTIAGMPANSCRSPSLGHTASSHPPNAASRQSICRMLRWVRPALLLDSRLSTTQVWRKYADRRVGNIPHHEYGALRWPAPARLDDQHASRHIARQWMPRHRESQWRGARLTRHLVRPERVNSNAIHA
jgi:hypothetical protein